MEMKLRLCCGSSRCIPVSICSSFSAFTLAKKKSSRPCSPIYKKQGRIFQTDTGGYFPSGWAAKSDSSLIRAAWVLLDFIGQVEYHAPGDFPVKLIFFANGELYEIIYAASGQEALINHALRDDSSGGRRIILVDNPEDIRRIDCPGISGFCTVDAAGQVHYFKKTGGT